MSDKIFCFAREGADVCKLLLGHAGPHQWLGRSVPAAQPTEVSGLPTPIQDPNDDLAWLVNGIRAQANDYLTKPTGEERLVALTTLRAHALVLREDFQDNGCPVVDTETAPAEVSERLKAQLEMVAGEIVTWAKENPMDALAAEHLTKFLTVRLAKPLLAELAALREREQKVREIAEYAVAIASGMVSTGVVRSLGMRVLAALSASGGGTKETT